jgi:hypothetical protein
MNRLKLLFTQYSFYLVLLGCFLNTALAEKPCPICGLPFRHGQYIIHDFWKNKYHSHHESELRNCYSCARLIHPGLTGKSPFKNGGNHLSDGRSICNVCIKSNALIYYPVQAQQVLEEVLESSRQLGVDIPNIYQIELVDDEKMAAIRQTELRPGEKNPALTSLRISRQIMRGRSKVDTKCKVYILSGLHELYFRQCLAHELMHVWIFVNCQYDPKPPLNEGSCNYLAYRILQQQEDSDYKKFYLRSMEVNRNPVYGDGFRKVRKWVDEFGGLKTFLQFLQYNDDFPKTAQK